MSLMSLTDTGWPMTLLLGIPALGCGLVRDLQVSHIYCKYPLDLGHVNPRLKAWIYQGRSICSK